MRTRNDYLYVLYRINNKIKWKHEIGMYDNLDLVIRTMKSFMEKDEINNKYYDYEICIINREDK